MSSLIVIQISGDAGQSLPDIIELSSIDAQNIGDALRSSRGLGPGEVAQRLGAAFAQTGSLRVLQHVHVPPEAPPPDPSPGVVPPAPGDVPQEGDPLAPLEPAPPIAPPVVDTPEP